MESRGEGLLVDIDLDALAVANLVERLEGEAGVVPLEEGVALEELAFDTLCMAAGSEGLPVAVLLVADGAGSGTGGAARMLRVALNFLAPASCACFV